MTNQDTWGCYVATPWNGSPIADGAFVAFRSTKYEDGFVDDHYGHADLASFVNTMPYRSNKSNPPCDYLTINLPASDSGCVFKVHTWPRLEGEIMPSNNPDKYQKIILQTATGNYVTTDPTGYYISSAGQNDARVFALDLTCGTQTVLYHLFYNYSQRSVMDPQLYRIAHNIGIYSACFFKPSVPEPIFLKMLQGEGPLIDVFIMTPKPLTNGMHARSPEGTIFLVLDNKLRGIINPTVYNSLFRDWTTTLIASAGSYNVGSNIDQNVYLATGTPDGKVFLVIDGTKRWIIGPPVFDKYGFNWNTVRTLPADQLAAIPNGTDIT